MREDRGYGRRGRKGQASQRLNLPLSSLREVSSNVRDGADDSTHKPPDYMAKPLSVTIQFWYQVHDSDQLSTARSRIATGLVPVFSISPYQHYSPHQVISNQYPVASTMIHLRLPL